MLLLCLSHCLDPFLYMLNFSLSHSTFPSSWKHSIVLSIPKTPNPSSPSSFRSISLPPLLSKLLDCIYYTSHNLMPLSQILISFSPVSQVFIDLTARRRNCFTFLSSCFMISTRVALLPSLRWTSQRVSILSIMTYI